jgi:glycosyltransferase involved in cell wall biosynthesis
MPELYGRADIFCLPSWWEAMPLSVLEAMAAGLPVVATGVGDVPRIVTDGVTGMLVEPHDPAGLAVALEDLLGDPAMRLALGDAGRSLVERDYDSARMLAALESLYDGL